MEPLKVTELNFIKDKTPVILSEEAIEEKKKNVIMLGGGTVLENLDKAESALEMIDDYVETLLKQCGITIDERPLFYAGEGYSLAIMAVNVAKWLEDIEKKLKLVLEKLGA